MPKLRTQFNERARREARRIQETDMLLFWVILLLLLLYAQNHRWEQERSALPAWKPGGFR